MPCGCALPVLSRTSSQANTLREGVSISADTISADRQAPNTVLLASASLETQGEGEKTHQCLPLRDRIKRGRNLNFLH